MIAESWVDRLFSRMKSIYPRDWGKGLQTESDWANMRKEWQAGLNAIHEITGDGIGKAIDYCRDNYKFAPVFSEFREAYQLSNLDKRQFFVVKPEEAPVPGDTERVKQILVGIVDRINSNRPRRMIRQSPEYHSALADARKAGKPLYFVDLEFLEQGGWTALHEQEYIQHCRVIGFGDPARFFPPGHVPVEFKSPPPPVRPREVAVVYRGAD